MGGMWSLDLWSFRTMSSGAFTRSPQSQAQELESKHSMAAARLARYFESGGIDGAINCFRDIKNERHLQNKARQAGPQ